MRTSTAFAPFSGLWKFLEHKKWRAQMGQRAIRRLSCVCSNSQALLMAVTSPAQILWILGSCFWTNKHPPIRLQAVMDISRTVYWIADAACHHWARIECMCQNTGLAAPWCHDGMHSAAKWSVTSALVEKVTGHCSQMAGAWGQPQTQPSLLPLS